MRSRTADSGFRRAPLREVLGDNDRGLGDAGSGGSLVEAVHQAGKDAVCCVVLATSPSERLRCVLIGKWGAGGMS